MNEVAQQQQLTEAEKAEVLAKLSDPMWRIRNLYRIVDKRGREIPFVPTAEQEEILHAVFVLKQKRHAVLKARQMGFSTLIEIIILDACYFGQNVQASIIDQTQAHASEKLEKKIRFAYERLGPLREKLAEDNAREMAFSNGSHISAGKNARGGTNQFMHISEWGPIAHEDPQRSEEIKTGALPTVEHGCCFVETTFKGGKGGHLYELMKQAMETPAAHRTDKDFVFWFFPWYLDRGYTLEGDQASIPPALNAYLDQKEREIGVGGNNVRTIPGGRFTPGQRLWYAKTKAEQGIFMFREYPTTVDEAFKAPVEGSIYGEVISAIRGRGQICSFQWERGVPVFSVWDLDWSDTMCVWLVQIVGRDVHWICSLGEKHRTAAEMWQKVDATGIPVAVTFLPHDGGSRDGKRGTSYEDEFRAAGARNIIVVPRPLSRGPGINLLRDLLQRSWFRSPQTEDGITALEAYHMKNTDAGGTVTQEPVHDWASHYSDAARVFAEALNLGLVNTHAAAKKAREMAPRYPDGSLADHAGITNRRQRKLNAVALSGHTPFR